MQHQILDAPDFGMLKITFDGPGESVISEAGAMVAMGTQIDIKTAMQGGLLGAAKRAVLGGESLFQNTYTSKAAGQDMYFSPATEGDVRAMPLAAGQSVFLQSGAYLAHYGEGMVIDTKWGGVKGFFGGGGLFMLRATGPGVVFYNAYGALHEVAINGQTYTVDNAHVVGWTDGLQFNLRKFGGYKGLFFSGEGLVCDFSGVGTVLLQTRNPSSLAAFLGPFRPAKSG